MTTSNAQAAGVGRVIATDAVALDTATRGVDVQWSENATADSFGKNLDMPHRGLLGSACHTHLTACATGVSLSSHTAAQSSGLSGSPWCLRARRRMSRSTIVW